MKTPTNIPVSATGAILGFIAGLFVAFKFWLHEKPDVFTAAIVTAFVSGIAFGRVSSAANGALGAKGRFALLLFGCIALTVCSVTFWRMIF